MRVHIEDLVRRVGVTHFDDPAITTGRQRRAKTASSEPATAERPTRGGGARLCRDQDHVGAHRQARAAPAPAPGHGIREWDLTGLCRPSEDRQLEGGASASAHVYIFLIYISFIQAVMLSSTLHDV